MTNAANKTQMPIAFARQQLIALKRIAKARHTSTATIVREAVDAYLATLEKKA